VAGLAQAIRAYDQDRNLLLAHARAGREIAFWEFDWQRRGEQMNQFYLKLMSNSRWPGSTVER
jgi:type VI protein secretion system component Hcp